MLDFIKSVLYINEKRKANGIAAKQFFIHKSLFKEAEELMAPIIAKSKEIVAQNA